MALGLGKIQADIAKRKRITANTIQSLFASIWLTHSTFIESLLWYRYFFLSWIGKRSETSATEPTNPFAVIYKYLCMIIGNGMMIITFPLISFMFILIFIWFTLFLWLAFLPHSPSNPFSAFRSISMLSLALIRPHVPFCWAMSIFFQYFSFSLSLVHGKSQSLFF